MDKVAKAAHFRANVDNPSYQASGKLASNIGETQQETTRVVWRTGNLADSHYPVNMILWGFGGEVNAHGFSRD